MTASGEGVAEGSGRRRARDGEGREAARDGARGPVAPGRNARGGGDVGVGPRRDPGRAPGEPGETKDEIAEPGRGAEAFEREEWFAASGDGGGDVDGPALDPGPDGAAGASGVAEETAAFVFGDAQGKGVANCRAQLQLRSIHHKQIVYGQYQG